MEAKQFGACHVNGGDCFLDGCFVCADDGDDGQAEVTCDLDVQVEFDCERVGGQVDAVDDYDVAVCGDLFVGGDCACGDFFGVAVCDECECVGQELRLTCSSVRPKCSRMRRAMGSSAMVAVEDGAEEADAVCAGLDEGVC